MNSADICCWTGMVLFVAMILLLSYGAIKRGSEEAQLRKKLLEKLEEEEDGGE